MPRPANEQNGAEISIGVTVDLELSDTAGGHVKCWQRFAEAAAGVPSLDLTVYFLGNEEALTTYSDRVRFRTVVPVRGTRSIGLRNVPGHTDLARRHASVERYLAEHDVLHATGPFALSGSAQYTSASARKPLVSSVHTDNTAYARLCTAEVVAGFFGGSRSVRMACERLCIPRISAFAMKRRVERGLSKASHLLYSNDSQRLDFRRRYGHARFSRLRRGVDHELFNPGKRNRPRLTKAFGAPCRAPILVFAGRLDATKNVLSLVAAAEHLWASGLEFGLLMIGDGPLRRDLERRCGKRGIFPGWVSQQDLA